MWDEIFSVIIRTEETKIALSCVPLMPINLMPQPTAPPVRGADVNQTAT